MHLPTSAGTRLFSTVFAFVLYQSTYLMIHLGFYGVQKSQNQLQAKILLFFSNYTIKSLFSGVSPPPTLQIGNFPAPISTMQASFHLKLAVCEKYDIHHVVANSSFCIAQTIHVCFCAKNTVFW